MVYSTVGVGDILAEATCVGVHFQFLQQLCKTVLLWPFNQRPKSLYIKEKRLHTLG